MSHTSRSAPASLISASAPFTPMSIPRIVRVIGDGPERGRCERRDAASRVCLDALDARAPNRLARRHSSMAVE